MEMNDTVFVCICDFVVIDIIQPVICSDSPGVGKDQSAQGVLYRRTFFYPPVQAVQISIHQICIINDVGGHISDILMLHTVYYISLCHIKISGFCQYLLYGILNDFDPNGLVLLFFFQLV